MDWLESYDAEIVEDNDRVQDHVLKRADKEGLAEWLVGPGSCQTGEEQEDVIA